jgi:tripeptide aminopeptidase
MIQEKRIVDHFRSLVAIDAPSRGERALAETVKGQLRALGLSIEEDQAGAAIGGDCNNIYATWPGTLDWPPLIFCVHFDTVEPGKGKRAVIGSDGIITSAGDTVLGADDLSGLTAIVEAIRSIARDGLEHRTVELFLTVAEEQHLLGSLMPNCSASRAGRLMCLTPAVRPGQRSCRLPATSAWSSSSRASLPMRHGT